MKERANPWLRRADRWIGIPLVLLVGTMVRFKRAVGRTMHRRVDDMQGQQPPRSITLLKSAAIGDTVMLSAVVRDMRAHWPDAAIRIACGNSNAAVARMVLGVEEVIVLPMSSPPGIWRARHRIRGDIFIDFDSWPRINALISHVSGSTTTVGFRTAGQHRHALYDLVVDHSFDLHEVENYRNLLRALARRGSAVLQATSAARPWLRGAETEFMPTSPFVVLHMFAGGSQSDYKEWEPTHWEAVARACFARGVGVLLTGGPADQARNDRFRANFDATDPISVLPVRPLAALMPLLATACAVVSVDTGIAHLAGAAAAPTIVLYGPTSPQRWGVLGSRVTCIKDSQTPWINLGFETSEGGRSLQLAVDDVLPTVLEQLGAGQ